MKHPRSHIRSVSQDTNSKPEEEGKFNLDYVLPSSSELINLDIPSRQTPQFDNRSDISQVSSSQDADRKSRKSARISMLG